MLSLFEETGREISPVNRILVGPTKFGITRFRNMDPKSRPEINTSRVNAIYIIYIYIIYIFPCLYIYIYTYSVNSARVYIYIYI